MPLEIAPQKIAPRKIDPEQIAPWKNAPRKTALPPPPWIFFANFLLSLVFIFMIIFYFHWIFLL